MLRCTWGGREMGWTGKSWDGRGIEERWGEKMRWMAEG